MRNPWNKSVLVICVLTAIEIALLVMSIILMRWVSIAICIFGVVFMSAMVGASLSRHRQYEENKKRLEEMVLLLDEYERGLREEIEGGTQERTD